MELGVNTKVSLVLYLLYMMPASIVAEQYSHVHAEGPEPSVLRHTGAVSGLGDPRAFID